jgi:hypothetical protein
MRDLSAAWFANCGKQATREEGEEFVHAFGESDPTLLRRAIDEYATTGAEFMKLAGLRAMYARLAATARAADGSKASEVERQDAERWCLAKGYEAHGFKFAESRAVMSAREVRSLVARHSNARGDHACCRSFKTWSTVKASEAREVMRVCRIALAAGGYEFIGLPPGPSGHVEVEFDAHGWWPRVVPPAKGAMPNVVAFAADDAARNLAAFKSLEAEVAKMLASSS